MDLITLSQLAIVGYGQLLVLTGKVDERIDPCEEASTAASGFGDTRLFISEYLEILSLIFKQFLLGLLIGFVESNSLVNLQLLLDDVNDFGAFE